MIEIAVLGGGSEWRRIGRREGQRRNAITVNMCLIGGSDACSPNLKTNFCPVGE